MTDILSIIMRTVLILLLLLLVSRILGRKTLSELTFYDFVISLVLGHIGGSIITEEFKLSSGIIALSASTLWVLAIHVIALKSIPARKLIDAEPLMVMHKGKIIEDNLKKRYYNVNDLLEMLREQGTFDPDEVEVALIESDGHLSVLKKPEYQTVTPKDISLNGQKQAPGSKLAAKEIIIDGQINAANLAQSGLTPEALEAELISLGIKNVEDVLLGMVTPDGKLYVDRKKN